MEEIILVQPKAGMYEIAGVRLPLSCLAVATLPDKEGYRVRIIDQRIDDDWEKTLRKSLKSNPVCVGVTSMTGPQIRHALDVSRIVKEEGDTSVVWGGVHPSLLPQQTLKNDNIDVVVCGEGEATFLDLVFALEKEKSLDGIRGVWYKDNGKIRRNLPLPFVDLNSLPRVPYHLVDVRDYTEFDFTGKGERSISIMTSRGCPFRCGFCYNTAFNQGKWRALSVENSLKRIKYVVEKFRVKSIYFPEDNFSADLKRFEGIVRGIISEGLDISWGAQGIRMDSFAKMGDKLLKLVVKSGCQNLDIGIESGSPRILKLIKKDSTVEQYISGARKLSGLPFIVKYNFIIGYPTETMEELNLSINLATKFIEENEKAYVLFHIYTPFPGTELFQKSAECGFRPPEKLEDWAKFNYIDWVERYPSWFSDDRKTLLSNLSFITRFSNENLKYKFTNEYMRLLFSLYYPIAKFRFDHNFYSLFIEKIMERHARGFYVKHLSKLIMRKQTGREQDR